eukprot:c13662_g1_i1 orf=267-548(+)
MLLSLYCNQYYPFLQATSLKKHILVSVWSDFTSKRFWTGPVILTLVVFCLLIGIGSVTSVLLSLYCWGLPLLSLMNAPLCFRLSTRGLCNGLF